MMSKKNVLFVCVENANRSQMAQAFATILGGENVTAYSAGSKPSGVINPKAIQYMRELHYDLSAHSSKSLDELPDIEFDFVATMGCGDKCPFIKAKRRTDWALPDPKHLEGDEYRAIRDQIKAHIATMLTEIGVPVKPL
jgi:arsenate reductase